ncbi:MAG: hypothetical protein ACYC3S_03525 [Chloroflexota bacterium]
MEWPNLFTWLIGAAVLAVPMALLLVVGTLIAVFPFAVLASALLRLDGSEPAVAEPVTVPDYYL